MPKLAPEATAATTEQEPATTTTAASEPARTPAAEHRAEEPVGEDHKREEAKAEEPKGEQPTHAQAQLASALLATARDVRLTQKGMSAGSPVMIRIFKAESELELWMRKDERFELFATYPICRWSGKLGPKLHEGDKQAPEGIYSVALPQIRRRGRWPRSLNIGYPNAFDRALERTGSLILVHGGCTSTGCYAMTNPVINEIHGLVEQALRQGQPAIPLHVFPFRMSEENLAAHADSEWLPFWRNIKEAYDVFERTRTPPLVSVCGKRYVVAEGAPAWSVQQAGIGSAGVPDAACVGTEADAEQHPVTHSDTDRAKPDKAEKTSKARKAESRTQRRRSAGRNARKAYAEARKARVAAHSQRARKQASTARSAR